MARKHLTEEEALAELKRWVVTGSAREPGTLTTWEIADALGVSTRTALYRIRSWVRAGKLEPVRVRVTDIVGRETTTYGYRVKV